MTLHLIAAMSRDRCIGKGGALPWRLPEDLKHFKRLTTGHAIIMGRKTFESIGKALPDRTSIVLSSMPASSFPSGVLVEASFEAAVARAREIDPAPFVVGGGDVYRAALPFVTHLHLTYVDVVVDGCDTHFPKLPEGMFVETSRRAGDTAGVTFVDYVRAER